MEIGTEISKKIRAAIKTKLEELGAYVDEELPDYIMVMVANKKTRDQMQGDLSLFLGAAAAAFTDWLQQLLNKLQNITAETLERQLKAQQKAEKTGQSSHSTKVLLTLDKKTEQKNLDPSSAQQLPLGDFISIRTDDVIEGLNDDAPPKGGVAKEAVKKKSELSLKEPPSLVQARQALDDALRKKRDSNEKIEMPKKLLKTASTSSTKRQTRDDKAKVTKSRVSTGGVLKERDVDEQGRIIGSIVKVTDKKGKSLVQSKSVSTHSQISKSLSSSSRTMSKEKISKSSSNRQCGFTLGGMRSDEIMSIPGSNSYVAKSRRSREDDREDDRSHNHSRLESAAHRCHRPNITSAERSRADEALMDLAHNDGRHDAQSIRPSLPRDSKSDFHSDSRAISPEIRRESRMYSDRREHSARSRQEIPNETRQLPASEARYAFAGDRALRRDKSSDVSHPRTQTTPSPSHRSRESRKRDSNEDSRSKDRRRHRSGGGSSRRESVESDDAIVLKKDNGKTVKVTRAHLQSFKVHIKNRVHKASESSSVAVDDYALAEDFSDDGSGGETAVTKKDGPSIPASPESYIDDDYDQPFVDNRLRAGSRVSDHPMESEDESRSQFRQEVHRIQSIRNVRPKSPTPGERESRSRSHSGDSIEQSNENNCGQVDERRFQANVEDKPADYDSEEEMLYGKESSEKVEMAEKPRQSSIDIEPAPPGTEDPIVLPHEKGIKGEEIEENKEEESGKFQKSSSENGQTEPNWRDIVAAALKVDNEEVKSKTKAEAKIRSEKRERVKPRLKRPPPPHGLSDGSPPRKSAPPPVQPSSTHGALISSPREQCGASSSQRESPKFIVTLDGVDASKFADKKTRANSNDHEGLKRRLYDEEVTLDGSADDDVFLYINEEDVEDCPPHDSLKISFATEGESSAPTSKPSVSPDISMINRNSSKTTSNISLPVRFSSTSNNSSDSVPKFSPSNAPPPLDFKFQAKATASVAPQRTAPSQFSWQNPRATIGAGASSNSTVESTASLANITHALAGIRKSASTIRRALPPTSDGPEVPHSSGERCRFWPACRAGESCPFQHPTTPCKAFPRCRFGDKCLFIHPNCKYDAQCTKLSCPYTHASKRGNLFARPPIKKFAPTPPPARSVFLATPGPESTETMPCRYGNACAKRECQFSHPDNRDRGQSIRPDMSTEMAEKILNFPTKLVWKKN